MNEVIIYVQFINLKVYITFNEMNFKTYVTYIAIAKKVVPLELKQNVTGAIRES